MHLPQATVLPEHSLPSGYFPERDERAAVVVLDGLHDTALYPFAGGSGVRVPFLGGLLNGPILAHAYKVARGSDSA